MIIIWIEYREKFLKSGQNRKWLDELVGITPDSRPGFWNDFPSEAEKRDREAGIWKNSARYLALRGFSED